MDSFFVKPGTNKRMRGDISDSSKSIFNRNDSKRARGTRINSRGTRAIKSRGRGASNKSDTSIFDQNGFADTSNGMGKHKRKFNAAEEEISSGESDEDQVGDVNLRTEFSESEEETEQEKRLRLTKDYLRQLEEHTEDKDIDQKLQEEVLEAAGRLHRNVAGNFDSVDFQAVRILKGHSGHKLSITCVSSDGKIIFSGGKEGALIKWNIESRLVMKKILPDKTEAVGHSGSVLALNLSWDSKYLASAGSDKLIKIWCTSAMELFHTFRGHRDFITGVAFRMNTHQLFSCSKDRNVKVWNVDEKSYVETLYGHQNAVMGIDSFHKERCITAGGQDFSVRIWKVLEESQLVFQLQFGSVECISLVDEEHFVTGNDDGSIFLWGIHKKKPMYSMRQVHKNANGVICWVSSIDALKNTDLFASGSNSGEIFVWKIHEGYRSISVHFKIPIFGFVNSLKFVSDGRMIIAGVGQEHRMGRWWREKESKNAVHVFPLSKSQKIAETSNETTEDHC